jgi:hypothetical protein
MNEDQLKREIEEALSVEPSPQFMARVRRGIAAEPRPQARPWTLLAVGFASAALMVGILVFLPGKSGSLVPETPKEIARTEAPPSPPIETLPSSEQTLKPVARVKPAAGRRPAEPEVLFDPREAAAFRSFMEAVQEKKINASRLDALFEAVERAAVQIDPMPIAGAPIEITPLEPAAGEIQREGETL